MKKMLVFVLVLGLLLPAVSASHDDEAPERILEEKQVVKSFDSGNGFSSNVEKRERTVDYYGQVKFVPLRTTDSAVGFVTLTIK